VVHRPFILSTMRLLALAVAALASTVSAQSFFFVSPAPGHNITAGTTVNVTIELGDAFTGFTPLVAAVELVNHAQFQPFTKLLSLEMISPGYFVPALAPSPGLQHTFSVTIPEGTNEGLDYDLAVAHFYQMEDGSFQTAFSSLRVGVC